MSGWRCMFSQREGLSTCPRGLCIKHMKEVELLQETHVDIGRQTDWKFIIDKALEKVSAQVPPDPNGEEAREEVGEEFVPVREDVADLADFMEVMNGLLAEDVVINMCPSSADRPMHVVLRNPYSMAGHYMLNA